MTTLRWDHTVHNVNNLDNSIAAFEQNGLLAFHGGSHTEWGTYNALSYFGLTYIELMGIEKEELAQQADSSHLIVKDALNYLPEHEAFGRVALRTDNIEETAAALKEKGLELSPIMNGKRLNAQGELIEWKMLTIQGDFQGLAYPFVIQWKGSDEERLVQLTQSGVIQPHPVGEITIQEAVFVVPNPIEVARRWADLFGLLVTESSDSSPTLLIGEQKFIYKQGTINRLAQLVFHTEVQSVKGKTMTIGEAVYMFK